MELTILLQAFFTLGILSSLYRYNVWYKFCEHTFIAVSLAVTATAASRTILNNAIYPILSGDLFLLFPVALGLLYLTRISGKYGHYARISMAVIVGSTLGSSIRVIVNTDIIGQMIPVLNLSWFPEGAGIGTILGNIYSWLGLIAGLTYFVFSTTWIKGSVKKPYDQVSKLGRIVLLAMIGAQFANTAMGRTSVFIERIYFLLKAFGLAA